ncbi:MAG: hypothetical protein ABIK86_00885 [candidate division WOR-3 bacterium]
MAAEPDRNKQGAGVPQPPRLEFRPDLAKAGRIRAFRIVTLGLAAVVLAACLILMIAFQPRGVSSITISEPGPAGEVVSIQSPVKPAATPVTRQNSTTGVRDAVVELEKLLGDVREYWRRAVSYVPLSLPAEGQLDEAVARVRRAVVMAESAAALADSGRKHLAGLKEALRQTGAGGYRGSELSSAADDFLLELRACAADRLEHFRAQELAYVAFAAGDSAEFEVKGDVATGYLRKSELRERRIEQAKGRMRVALAELER